MIWVTLPINNCLAKLLSLPASHTHTYINKIIKLENIERKNKYICIFLNVYTGLG